MKFIHLLNSGAVDGAGQLMVVSENNKETKNIFNVFFGFAVEETDELILRKADAIRQGHYTHVTEEKKRFWYVHSGTLDAKWSQPYFDAIKKYTGYSGSFPRIDLTDLFPKRLTHTHIVDSIVLNDDGTISWRGMVSSEPWNGKSANEYAFDRLEKLFKRDVGSEVDKNKFRYYEPKLSCAWIYNALFQWWRENHATDAQKTLLDLADKWALPVGNTPDYVFGQAYDYCHINHGGMIVLCDGEYHESGKERYYKNVTWEQFKALG